MLTFYTCPHSLCAVCVCVYIHTYTFIYRNTHFSDPWESKLETWCPVTLKYFSVKIKTLSSIIATGQLPTSPNSHWGDYPIALFCTHVLSHSVVSDCDPMDCSLPGSSVHGILQARILEWLAVSSSSEVLLFKFLWLLPRSQQHIVFLYCLVCVCVCVCVSVCV